jgi:flagellar basal-body rod protein FlgF
MAKNVNATASSLQDLMQRYQTITTNLSNASTVGYKRRGGSFSSVMDRQQAGQDAAAGAAPRDAIDLTQGSLAATGDTLDLAIDGKGFFVIETPVGEMYTRCGSVRVNPGGRLVDSAGNSVAGEQGAIVLPQSATSEDLSVGPDGSVSANGQILGRLKVVDFDDPGALHAVSATMFRAPEGLAAKEAGTFSVKQGYREQSNVNVVREMVDLITVSRMYEANFKSMQKASDSKDQLLRVAMA